MGSTMLVCMDEQKTDIGGQFSAESGKPVGADRGTFDRERFDRLCKKLADGYADVSEEEGMKEIDELVWKERHKNFDT